ncbi:MAG: hypothetical protein HZA48_12225 [Planctomycetes bacterium]|nr:hypothetical protein [Planctomycetota bacterium]
MNAGKVRGYSFAKVALWMGLASVLILTVAVFAVKRKPSDSSSSNSIPTSSSISSDSSLSANISDTSASANNKNLNDRISLSDDEKATSKSVKAVSDIKTDDPLRAIPLLKKIIENTEETPAVKTLALSKLIEINTTESINAVSEYVKNKNAETPWVRNTAVALLVKADTPLSNGALDKLKSSGDTEIVEFLNKLQR